MPENKEEKEQFDIMKETEDNVVDDVSFEEDEAEVNPKDTIKKLREALKTAQKERSEYLDGWQRMKADLVNAKRQEEEWRKEFVKFAGEKLLVRLLPVLESFNLATANREAWEALPKDWRLGMEHIYRELVNALSEHGLSEIAPKEKEPFNPSLHESVETRKTSDKALDHAVAATIQKGYSLSDKVLKPARVALFEFE